MKKENIEDTVHADEDGTLYFDSGFGPLFPVKPLKRDFGIYKSIHDSETTYYVVWYYGTRARVVLSNPANGAQWRDSIRTLEEAHGR